MAREASCVWTVTPALILAIDAQLGPPVDSYINGSQTWFTDEPSLADMTLEWRLHPVAEFTPLTTMSADDRWDAVVHALEARPDGTALALGDEQRDLSSLWDGFECYVAYGEECEPAPLAQAATERLGIAPTANGLVDHDAVGDAWERNHGSLSITALLMEQLAVIDG